jgi:hypothetical protein
LDCCPAASRANDAWREQSVADAPANQLNIALGEVYDARIVDEIDRMRLPVQQAGESLR